VQFGGKKYLWGNVTAFDILQLGANEGNEYGGQLHLLFANMCGYLFSESELINVFVLASGDLRNVVRSIARIPKSYKQFAAISSLFTLQ
jgi:hypothetical protein